MPQIGWVTEQGERVLFEDALAEAREYGEALGFPYEILVGMHANLTKKRPVEVTVTTLLHCARRVQLDREADYYTSPLRNYPAFRGTIIHSVMEQAATPGAVTEKRYARDFEGVRISGGVDWYMLMEGNGRVLLRDFKSVSDLPKYNSAYTSHIQQVNLYRWLLDLDPESTDMEIVYISMDGVKIIPIKAGGETRSGRKITNQVWDDDKAEDFIRERLALLNRDLLPYKLVPEDDLWMCESYCEVKALCYRKAYQEIARSTDTEGRVPPRQRSKKW